MGRMELDALWLGYHRPPNSESVAITRTMQIIPVISTNLNHVQLQIVSRAKETSYPYSDCPPILRYVPMWCHYFGQGFVAHFDEML